MLPSVVNIIKSSSIPVLLLASIFARYAASYEFLVNLVVCMGALVGVHRAVQHKHFVWAGGFTVIAIVFSPLLLATKIFLLMGLTCFVACLALFMTFRMGPAQVRAAPAVLCALLLAIPAAGVAQPAAPLEVKQKLNFHAKNTFSPLSLAGLAAYAAILHEANAPEEWQHGAAA